MTQDEGQDDLDLDHRIAAALMETTTRIAMSVVTVEEAENAPFHLIEIDTRAMARAHRLDRIVMTMGPKLLL